MTAYLLSGDADRLVDLMDMAKEGRRRHRWMYDRLSLRKLLASAGFVQIADLEAGETTIEEPGALDLSEREDESLYIECAAPSLDQIGLSNESSLDADVAPFGCAIGEAVPGCDYADGTGAGRR